MMGEHSVPGGKFDFIDGNGTKVGEVVFTSAHDEFAAGRWYTTIVTKGRTQNANIALTSFIDTIESTHAKRR